MPHIFISYAKKDTRDLALALADALNKLDGVTAWVDRSLRAGKSWEIQIQTEIDRCDAMVVLYSPDINRHKHGADESYVLTEIAYARYTVKKPIIPIMAQKTDPPIALAGAHYIDYTLSGLTLDDLVRALCDEIGIAPTIPPATPSTPPHDTPSPLTAERAEPKSSAARPRRGAGGGVSPTAPAKSTSPHDTPPQRSGEGQGVGTDVSAALARARLFTGTRNTDWTPYTTTFPDSPLPDMPFCLVPAGTFTMGSSDTTDAKPHAQRFTEPFWISQYPVTNAQWAAAVRAGAVREPKDSDALKWFTDRAMADAPVVGVTWFMARDFAAWAGFRLPTEREWEYAARGVESWVYPWGDRWQFEHVVWGENSGGKPNPVTTRPAGASWVAAAHLSGNVLEWTSSLYDP